MKNLKFAKSKQKDICAVAGRNVYGLYPRSKAYLFRKVLPYIQRVDFQQKWFDDVTEAYEWSIEAFTDYNPENYMDFEYAPITDVVFKNFIFPYSNKKDYKSKASKKDMLTVKLSR